MSLIHSIMFLLIEQQLSIGKPAVKIISATFCKVEDNLDKFLINIMASIKVFAFCDVVHPAKCTHLDPKSVLKKICRKFP